MKWHMTIFICLLVICGCEKRQPSAEEKYRGASHKMMSALRTNATIRTIRSSSEIRSLLAGLKEQDEKSKIISEWQASLFEITVQGQLPSNQYGAIREASSVLDWDVACAMRECGYSLEDVWTYRFLLIDWLDGQIHRMRKICDNPEQNQREKRDSWTYYQALAEHREQFVENYERFHLDGRDFKRKEALLGELRQRLAEKLGRPVRRPEEIKALGLYAKEVRKRVLKERDEAFRGGKKD